MMSASFQELNTIHSPRQNPKLSLVWFILQPSQSCGSLLFWELDLCTLFPRQPVCVDCPHWFVCNFRGLWFLFSPYVEAKNPHSWEAATSEIHLYTHYAFIVWLSHSGCCKKGQGVREKSNRRPFPKLLIGIKNCNQKQKWFSLSGEVCAEESRGVCGGEDIWVGKWMKVWFETTCWHFQVPFLTVHTSEHISICRHLPSLQWN